VTLFFYFSGLDWEFDVNKVKKYTSSPSYITINSNTVGRRKRDRNYLGGVDIVIGIRMGDKGPGGLRHLGWEE
jgi:hypothetical protein